MQTGTCVNLVNFVNVKDAETRIFIDHDFTIPQAKTAYLSLIFRSVTLSGDRDPGIAVSRVYRVALSLVRRSYPAKNVKKKQLTPRELALVQSMTKSSVMSARLGNEYARPEVPAVKEKKSERKARIGLNAGTAL